MLDSPAKLRILDHGLRDVTVHLPFNKLGWYLLVVFGQVFKKNGKSSHSIVYLRTVSLTFCFAGEYGCLKAEIHLRRNIGYHLVQNYLPTILIVVISWVSFWLDVDAIPARITLGVTTLLTISSKGSSIQSNIPPVSYVKAVDVWTGACTTMVFCALLEFTLVNYLWRRKSITYSNSQETWVVLTSVSIYAFLPYVKALGRR